MACTAISTKNSTMVGYQGSMSKDWGMVGNERGMVGNKWGMVDRCMSNYSSWSVTRDTFIGDILDIS